MSTERTTKHTNHAKKISVRAFSKTFFAGTQRNKLLAEDKKINAGYRRHGGAA